LLVWASNGIAPRTIVRTPNRQNVSFIEVMSPF
jgi:hypothetical protein